MRSVVTVAALAIAAGITVPHYAAHLKGARHAAIAPQPAAAADADSSYSFARSVVVPRDQYGHFRIDGRIDGRRVEFMVDTGATMIALTESDAEALGIHPGVDDYTTLVTTANGAVRGAAVELDTVTVGDLILHDVSALVLPRRALSENLLGLSFLSRLRHFEYGDGKLVLQQ